jgi:hypothetical protein
MKGAGEPIFKYDFPPSYDIYGKYTKGPKAAERTQFAPSNCWATEVDLTQ